MARSRLYHSRFEYSRNLYSRYPEGRSAGMRLLAFSGNDWRKITKRDATKENTLREFCRVSGLSLGEIIAFGDDAPDIGMLRICGLSVATSNAIPVV